MTDDNLYPELGEEGKAQAQAIMDRFALRMRIEADRAISSAQEDLYVNVLSEIESDHWFNYRDKIVQGLCNYGNKDVSRHDWKKIREGIFAQFREEIINDLNQDLLKQNEELLQLLRMKYD